MRLEAVVADCTSGRYVGTESARETDTRHPDVAQVAARCCERNQLLLGSATAAGGLFNGTFCEADPRGCKVCTAEIERVYCAVRAASNIICYHGSMFKSY